MKALIALLFVGLLVLAGCGVSDVGERPNILEINVIEKIIYTTNEYGGATIEPVWFGRSASSHPTYLFHQSSCDTTIIRAETCCSDSMMIVTTWVDTTLVYDKCIKRVPEEL